MVTASVENRGITDATIQSTRWSQVYHISIYTCFLNNTIWIQGTWQQMQVKYNYFKTVITIISNHITKLKNI
jgi:hypothetical protein